MFERTWDSGKIERGSGFEDRGLSNTRHEAPPTRMLPFFHDSSHNVTSDSHALCHATSRLLSPNGMRDCLAFFFFFQLREEKSHYGAISWPEMG